VGIHRCTHLERHPGGYIPGYTPREAPWWVYLDIPREAPWWVYPCYTPRRHPGGIPVLHPEGMWRIQPSYSLPGYVAHTALLLPWVTGMWHIQPSCSHGEGPMWHIQPSCSHGVRGTMWHIQLSCSQGGRDNVAHTASCSHGEEE